MKKWIRKLLVIKPSFAEMLRDDMHSYGSGMVAGMKEGLEKSTSHSEDIVILPSYTLPQHQNSVNIPNDLEVNKGMGARKTIRVRAVSYKGEYWEGNIDRDITELAIALTDEKTKGIQVGNYFIPTKEVRFLELVDDGKE